jgi:hypothetical protein
MPRKNYAPAERALHIIGVLAGKSLIDINGAIELGDALKGVRHDWQKELPKASYDMLVRSYGPVLTSEAPTSTPEFWAGLWEHCVSPKKLGDLYGDVSKYIRNFGALKSDPQYRAIQDQYERRLEDIAKEEVNLPKPAKGPKGKRSAAPQPYSDPEKEARYQAFRKSQGLQ